MRTLFQDTSSGGGGHWGVGPLDSHGDGRELNLRYLRLIRRGSCVTVLCFFCFGGSVEGNPGIF